jgi:protein-tyrosine phosphatase
VLLVCTGNICRSALAERLGRAYLHQVLADDADRISLVSAGTQAVSGSGMHPDTALVLGGFGADAGDFRARQLQPAHVVDADLVLTMTRGHRRLVLQEAPRALSRTFTLREAADLLERSGADMPAAEGDFPDRARALVQHMAAARSLRQSGDTDDVPDPIAGPLEAHQAAGDLIVAALLPLLDRLAALAIDPPAQAGPGASDAPAVA